MAFEHNFSQPFVGLAEVPQGSTLGPLLFTLFNNDMSFILPTDKHLMFADDLKIFMTIRDDSDREELQQHIKNYHPWYKRNHLQLCVEKCRVRSFGRAREPSRYSYNIDRIIIETVNLISDLGIILNVKLTFNQQHLLGSHLLSAYLTASSQYSADYEARLKLLGLKKLSDRRYIRRMAQQMFVGGLLTKSIDSLSLLQRLDIYAPTAPLRPRPLINVPRRRTNYGSGDPLCAGLLTKSTNFSIFMRV